MCIRDSRSLVDSGQLVIACGGGGIPVTLIGNHLKGASAVIDKDFASELLAEELDADFLIILTAVEKVAINFGKPEEKWFDDITTDDARTVSYTQLDVYKREIYRSTEHCRTDRSSYSCRTHYTYNPRE